MMMAEVGSSDKVSGSRMAIPAEAPNPGMIPTIIPMKAPRRSKSIFVNVKATEKPCDKLDSISLKGLTPCQDRI